MPALVRAIRIRSPIRRASGDSSTTVLWRLTSFINQECIHPPWWWGDSRQQISHAPSRQDLRVRGAGIYEYLTPLRGTLRSNNLVRPRPDAVVGGAVERGVRMHLLRFRALVAVTSALLMTLAVTSVAFAGVGSGPWP
jgi:hypothetical protein